jgi:hypothetical protein
MKFNRWLMRLKKNESLEIDNDWEHSKNMEIWNDEMCLAILNENNFQVIVSKQINQGLASAYYINIRVMTT